MEGGYDGCVNEIPKAVVIRAAGTNCDAEMVRAFGLAGAACDLVHLNRLVAEPALLEQYDLIGFPGGFSYGDDIASGRVFAARLRERLYPTLRAAAERGVPMIGACNGFQVLVQVGLLPGPADGRWPEAPPEQTAALAENEGARFIDRWLRVEAEASSACVWTRGLVEREPPFAAEAMMLPIAHGEGRFVADGEATMRMLREGGRIALRYAEGENVNGSAERIAGICDASGLIFGLMPHPERYLEWANHPFWTRLPGESMRGVTPGLAMFAGAVAHVKGETYADPPTAAIVG